jgi:tetratricopeptide (TPR) repeat protein
MNCRTNYNLKYFLYLTSLVVVSGLGLDPAVQAGQPSTNTAQTVSHATQPDDPVPGMLRDANHEIQQGNLDAALDTLNKIIGLNSQSGEALLMRGSLYAQRHQWNEANCDYDLALAIMPDNPVAEFNFAELEFLQKQYDRARGGFSDLKQDKNLGDLAAYKAFLCDLFGAHEADAAKELANFNRAGGNPSYYFANAAWDLTHDKSSDAESWLLSASRIYANSPSKFANSTP